MRGLFKLMTVFTIITIPYICFGTSTEGFIYQSGNIKISLDMSVSRLSNGYTHDLASFFVHLLNNVSSTRN
ncbi:MAG: hypothetical protein IEMM0008_1543 [bacterium]|nr:MAG: hypothetical protein IEMM0008_1543 [bacterium]